VSHVNVRGRPRHPDQLTPNEWRVADAVRHGLSNRQIAERRGVSLDAIKSTSRTPSRSSA
jgi:DNA-binding NarL/FixJ family response regulator